MNQMQQPIYTKCFKYELEQHSFSLGDNGLWKKYFFEDPKRLKESCHLREDETIIKVDIYAFADTNPSFKQIDDGIWENSSPLFTQHVSKI